MNKRTKRAAHNAASWNVLLERVDYIEDPDDIKHLAKEILPARNYRCNGQTKEDFLKMVEVHDLAYFAYRRKNRLKGPTTERLFDEIIYSSEKGAYLTPDERGAIEAMLVKKFGENAAVRTAWHIDSNGRADLHLLISAKAPTLEDPDAYEVVFGKAIGNSIVASISCDRQIAELLNRNPDRQIEQTAARDVRTVRSRQKYKTKDTSLARQIAKKYPRLKITAKNIADLLTKLGHEVRKITEKAITVIFKKCFREQELPLRNLLLSIEESQIRLSREKKIEATLQIENASEDEVVPAHDATVADTAAADTPAAKLLAFFQAATGRTQVTSRKLTKLTKSTKGMINTSGTIKSKVLEKVSDEEKTILIELAAEYAQQKNR